VVVRIEKCSSSRTLESCVLERTKSPSETYAKVSKHERGVLGLGLEQDVLGFQVAVDNALVVEILDRVGDRADNIGGIPKGRQS
jgi:hypothetical protein